MNRIFIIIKHINSLITLLVLLAAVAFLVWISFFNLPWYDRGEIAVAKNTNNQRELVYLHLETLEPITGTDTVMINLSSHARPMALSSGGGYNNKIHNVLFLSGTEKKPRWLFETQDNVVLRASQLKLGQDYKATLPTQALYFEFLKKDSNGDGELNDKDSSTLALAYPDGSGFKEIVENVSQVMDYTVLDGQQFSIIYQSDKHIIHRRFSLADFAKTTEQLITDVPDHI